MYDQGVYIIPMAYPAALASVEGMWYDRLLRWVRISNNGFVVVGHAALCVVDIATGEVDYADFGRYITPHGFGRMRSKYTDPEVQLDITADLSPDGDLLNLPEILSYLYAHPEKTHGEGPLFASAIRIDDGARVAQEMLRWRQQESIPYGPFHKSNSNCSRFVHSFLRDTVPSDHPRARNVRRAYRLTPSTMCNVVAAAEDGSYYEVNEGGVHEHEVATFRDPVTRWFLRGTRHAPSRPNHRLPSNLVKRTDSRHWLGGTGSGAWFEIREVSDDLRELHLARIEDSGEEIFCKWYQLTSTQAPSTDAPVKVQYDTHAERCAIRQGDELYVYKAVPSSK